MCRQLQIKRTHDSFHASFIMQVLAPKHLLREYLWGTFMVKVAVFQSSCWRTAIFIFAPIRQFMYPTEKLKGNSHDERKNCV